jgi:Uma2 family endonuclease
MLPTTSHQKVLTRFSAFLSLFIMQHQLGDVMVAPVNLKINEDTVLQPDVVYVSVERKKHVTEKAITAAPELVVEVISPANYPKLREAKKETYAEFGIEEYWEIHPKSRKISVHALEENEETKENNYVIFSESVEKGRVISKVLEGFGVEVEDILPEENPNHQ